MRLCYTSGYSDIISVSLGNNKTRTGTDGPYSAVDGQNGRSIDISTLRKKNIVVL